MGFVDSLSSPEILDIRMASGVAPGLAADWDKFVTEPGSIVVAQQPSGLIVGAAFIRGETPTFEVNEILVHRAYPKQGIKQALVGAIIEKAITDYKLRAAK